MSKPMSNRAYWTVVACVLLLFAGLFYLSTLPVFHDSWNQIEETR